MPTDPTLVAALRDATAETLTMDARIATQTEVRLNARYEPDVAFVTVTLPEVTVRRLAALALAVARMQERGAFLDGGVLPWTLAVGAPGNGEDVVTNAPTLPAALAALLEDAP